MASKARNATYAQLPGIRSGSPSYRQPQADGGRRYWRDPATGIESPTAGPGGPNGREIRPMAADRTDDQDVGR